MKKFLIISLILVSVIIGYALPRPRFELTYSEEKYHDNTTIVRFEVYHDKETGQEFICAEGGSAHYESQLSCWTTGRTWE